MKKVFAIIFTLIVLLLIPMSVVAVTQQIDVKGNTGGFVKIEPPIDTTVYFDESGNKSHNITNRYIVFDVSDDGKTLSFYGVNVCVASLYVKGGNGYRIYDFGVGVSSAEGLESPLNNGGNVPEISHYGLIEIKLCETHETTQTSETKETTGTTETTQTTGITETTGTTETIETITTTTEPDIPDTGETDNNTAVIGGVLLAMATALMVLLRKNKIYNN